jgi:diaminopimelate epimerase
MQESASDWGASGAAALPPTVWPTVLARRQPATVVSTSASDQTGWGGECVLLEGNMPAVFSFSKYEGLGNDFIVVEVDREDDLPSPRAARLCDRHFGIGADGVLLILPARDGDCIRRMRVINADGSLPEMCGNGVRCVALHVARARGMREGSVRIDTDAGARSCSIEDTRHEGIVTVDMGVVRLVGERTIPVDHLNLTLTLADAGNPHAVTFGKFARDEVERLGPIIASHSDFPNGTNVGFARIESDGIHLVVWERGAGITLACGTGACAAVAAAAAKGLVPKSSRVSVRLPGGALSVRMEDDGRATLRGPARHVFSGVVTVD